MLAQRTIGVMVLVLKLLALVSFLGGPMLLMDTFRGQLGDPLAFALSFTPIVLMIFGSLALGDEPDLWRKLSVNGGTVGAALLFAQNAIAGWLLVQRPGPYAASFALYVVGIPVGCLSALLYLALALGTPWVSDNAASLLSEPRRAVLRDWSLLAISFGFVALSVIMWSTAPDKAIVTLVFFGACGLVSLFSIRRRWRTGRMLGQRELALALPPDRTLRPRRSVALLLFGGMLAGGLLIEHYSARYPFAFRAAIAVIAAIGGLGLTAVALGWAPIGYLLFDAACLTLGRRRYAIHVPWSAIEAVISTPMRPPRWRAIERGPARRS